MVVLPQPLGPTNRIAFGTFFLASHDSSFFTASVCPLTNLRLLGRSRMCKSDILGLRKVG